MVFFVTLEKLWEEGGSLSCVLFFDGVCVVVLEVGAFFFVNGNLI